MCYGPEFISRALDHRAYINRVTLDFSRRGKPTDNALVESFNGRLRDECLNTHVEFRATDNPWAFWQRVDAFDLAGFGGDPEGLWSHADVACSLAQVKPRRGAVGDRAEDGDPVM